MTMSYRTRIAYDVCWYSVAVLFLLMRLWARLLPSSRKAHHSKLAWTADALLVFVLTLASCVIGLDIDVQRKNIYYQEHPEFIQRILAIVRSLKISFFTEFAYFFLMWSIKGVFMCIYFDMSKRLPKKTRMVLFGVTGVLAATFISIIPMFVFWCKPIETNWSIGPDICTPQANLFVATWTSLLNILTDLLVLGVPFLILQNIQLGRQDKYAFASVIAVGTLTTLVGIVSYGLQVQVFLAWNDKNSTEANVEARVERVYLAAIAEVICAIIVVCMPALRVLIRNYSRKKNAARGSYFGRGAGTSFRPSVSRQENRKDNESRRHLQDVEAHPIEILPIEEEETELQDWSGSVPSQRQSL